MINNITFLAWKFTRSKIIAYLPSFICQKITNVNKVLELIRVHCGVGGEGRGGGSDKNGWSRLGVHYGCSSSIELVNESYRYDDSLLCIFETGGRGGSGVIPDFLKLK